MTYDIVPIKNRYRGMGRLLLATDLYTKQTQKEYDCVLNDYYEYISNVLQPPSKDKFIELIDMCKKFTKYGVMCEVIVYDVAPIETAFGYSLDFLGIDITHEKSESLLCECTNCKIKKFLNRNGLCDSKSCLNNIVPLLDHGDVTWDACYVYKVKY